HRVEVEFIDLPSDIFLALQDIEQELREKRRLAPPPQKAPSPDDPPAAEDQPPDEGASPPLEPPASIYEEFARRAGEPDHDTYWERHFEHNLSDDAYRLAAYEFGNSLRELQQDSPRWRAENLVREAFMRRKIAAAIAGGHKPEKIVAVVGAY